MNDDNGEELEFITPDDDGSAGDEGETDASETRSRQTEAEEAEGEGMDAEADEGDGDDLDLDDDDDETDDDGEPEFAEIERGGKKYKVPAALKDEFLMQADYTRKTQEVAQQRKALEQWNAQIQQGRKALEQQAEIQQQNIREYAQLSSLSEQLDQFNQIDWAAWEQQAPLDASSAWRQYQQLEKQRDNLARTLHQKETHAAQERRQRELHQQQSWRQEMAKQAQQTFATLEREIKGWNNETAAKVSQFAIDHLGYTPDELKQATGDPRAWKVMHMAQRLHEAQSKAARKAKASAPQEDAKPLTKTKRGRTAPAPSGLSDNLSADEWMRRRNKQIAERRR